MRIFSRLCLLTGILVSGTSLAQLTVPQIVQLPRNDFVWNWGRSPRVDDLQRPEFSIVGGEQQFLCELTGSFRPSSRMGDFENLRQFEGALSVTLYFIQDATNTLNELYRQNQLQWARLDCQIPDTRPEEEAKTQERLDRALERAQRQQERRRRDEADD